MKRLLLILATVVVLLILAVGATLASVFGGLRPLVDGQELPGGARRVLDGYSSAYVLPMGEKEVALVDCGDDVEAKTIKAELSRRGLGVEAVKAILVTHGHPDHIGGCKQFPAAQVYVGQADVPLVEGTQGALGLLPRMMGPQKKAILKGAHGLKQRETLQLGTLKVEAFNVPGHTGGSTAYLASGTLFLGDSGGIAADGSLRKANWLFSDDTAQNVASLHALGKLIIAESLDVRALVPAHTGSADSVKPLLDFN